LCIFYAHARLSKEFNELKNGRHIKGVENGYRQKKTVKLLNAFNYPERVAISYVKSLPNLA
jgi:hypothetical protein